MTEPRITDLTPLGDAYVRCTVVLEDGHEELVAVPWSLERGVRELAIGKAREQRAEREKKAAPSQTGVVRAYPGTSGGGP